MDISDKATAREELDRAVALAQRRPTGPEAIGICHNCEAPLDAGLRWCDAECRDEWTRYNKVGA